MRVTYDDGDDEHVAKETGDEGDQVESDQQDRHRLIVHVKGAHERQNYRSVRVRRNVGSGSGIRRRRVVGDTRRRLRRRARVPSARRGHRWRRSKHVVEV